MHIVSMMFEYMHIYIQYVSEWLNARDNEDPLSIKILLGLSVPSSEVHAEKKATEDPKN